MGRVSGGVYGFVNHYSNFISQEFVAATPGGPLAQAINFGDVRIQGLEFAARRADRHAATASWRSTARAPTRTARSRKGIGPNGLVLDDSPADNITPSKFVGALRFTETRGRWWVEYGVRTQTDVDRVALTLSQSPFLIPQDLLSLDGFTVQRLAWGVNLSRGRDRVGVTFAIENLANKYYRDHFQFAPSRGRSFTVGLNIGAF